MRIVAVIFAFALSVLVVRGHGELHPQIEAVSKLIAASPSNAALYLKRGELFLSHGDVKEALEDLERAEKFDPKLDAVLLAKGRALLQDAKAYPAAATLDTFLQKKPLDVEGHWVRGLALVKLQRREDAEEDFAFVMAGAPSLAVDHVLERARNLESAGKVESALGVMDEGIRKLGSVPALESMAAEFEVKLKKFDGALKRLDALANKGPRKEDYLMRKAQVLEQMGKPAEAKKAYEATAAQIATLPPQLRRSVRVMRMDFELKRKLEALKEAR